MKYKRGNWYETKLGGIYVWKWSWLTWRYRWVDVGFYWQTHVYPDHLRVEEPSQGD